MIKSYQLMASKKVTISMPAELLDLVDRAGRLEHRTRSEVLQEAVRTHFRARLYVPSSEERRMLDEALRDQAGNPSDERSWDEVRAEIFRS